MAKILAISDTHNQHNKLPVAEAVKEHGIDILIHSGDMTGMGSPSEIDDFLYWWSRLEVAHKVIVPGNHDFGFQGGGVNFLRRSRSHELKNTVIFTGEEHSVEIMGLKVWGNPYTPVFAKWAFMYAPERFEIVWNLFEEGLDLLVTHGPPSGILDQTARWGRIGCPQLAAKIRSQQSPPRVHIFGHNHNDGGKTLKGVEAFIPGTEFRNAAMLDEIYEFSDFGRAHIFELNPKGAAGV
jgi:predicted phosphodiesterase